MPPAGLLQRTEERCLRWPGKRSGTAQDMRSRPGGPGPPDKCTGPARLVANRFLWVVTGQRQRAYSPAGPTSAWPTARHGSAEIDDRGPQVGHILQLRQPTDPAPAGPGPAGTTKRLRRLEVVGGLVDHYRAGPEPLRVAESALERSSEHGRLQTQLAGVGNAQDLFVGPGGDDRQYRTEALLLGHQHLRGDPVEQCVLVVQSGRVAAGPAAAEQQVSASAGRIGEVAI